MRIKFEIDAYNNITILDADQEDNTIIVKQDGDKKVILVSTPDTKIMLDPNKKTGDIS